MNRKVRLQILGRDNYRCVACGTESNLTIHHRINRGAGGNKLVDSYAHLLTMCFQCNNLFEADAAVARRARVNGYKLQRNTNPPIDPSEIPVFYSYEGSWFLLNNQNEKKEVNNG